MMVTNLETSWLIRFFLSFAIIFLVFALLRYFNFYRSDKKLLKRFKILLLVESISWLFFFLYFLYHFFIQIPMFTTIVLILMILMLIFIWKDLFSGYLLRLNGRFSPGTRLLIDNEEWNVSKIAYLHTTLLNDSGIEKIIPNKNLIAEQIGIINYVRQDLKLELILDKHKLDLAGGWEKLSTQIISTPWASPKQKPRLSDRGDGLYLLECWAFNPGSKARYKEFIESLLLGSK